MSLRASAGAAIRRSLREDELGKAGIALALALLTVLAAIVAGLQGQASIEAQRGNREADRIGLEAIGRDTTSVIQIGTAYGVYRRWFEQIERANWAQNQQTVAVDSASRPQLDALYQAEVDIEAWTKAQSDLFSSTYFKGSGNPDGAKFEADKLYRAANLAAEQRSIEAEVASAWDGKAAEYVTILTILAVGLFFLGLGSTVRRRARPMLASAGVLFGVGAAVWTIAVVTAPIHRVPGEAINQVVASQISLSTTDDEHGQAKLSDASRKGFAAAIDQADLAVKADPSYPSAYRARATARTGFADSLFFASGPSDEVTALLNGAVADYRSYTAMRPDDYGAWWNLGWSLYLAGDQPASVDATNQALIHSPAQFTLYLNRALAFLAGGDQKQAMADVDEAIRRAAQDSTDSSQYYLGQSDFDLGRLAAIHPDQADVLRNIQVRLRETQVSLRVFGAVTPVLDAPPVGAVTLEPLKLKRYQGGTLVEGAPVADKGSILSTDANGVRLSIADAAPLLNRTVSARVWLNGLPASEYNVDLTVKNLPLTLDLVSPYGRAGFNLDVGNYQIDLYVDGARRFQAAFTVQPPPDAPQYVTTAAPLLANLKSLGFACGDPQPSASTTRIDCDTLDSTDQTTYIVDVEFDAKDRITYLILGATTPTDSTADINKLGHVLFAYVLKQIYPTDLATTAINWVNTQDVAVDDFDVGGATLRVYGNSAHQRSMDIYSPWP